MSGMFWIALERSIPKIGFNIMLSLTVKNVDAFKFDGVAESDNTGLLFPPAFSPVHYFRRSFLVTQLFLREI